MAEPVHSFAVLAYGDSPFLEECLRSLRAQTTGSPIYVTTATPSSFIDRTARRWDVPVCINPRPEGIAGDWTFAYRACTTPYLTLAHQDDLYVAGYAQSCLDAARRCPDPLIIFTDYQEVGDGRVVTHGVNLLVKRALLAAMFGGGRCLSHPRRKRRLLSLGCVIACPSVMFHRRLIGDFAFSPDYQVDLDWDAWTRLAQRPGSFCYLPQRLVTHRLHGGAATAQAIAGGIRQREDLAMFLRYWPGPAARLIARTYRLSLRTRRK
ncbi:MAG TPA: glycosyltransferase family 2 protein [Candidatus Edwardsbacteria bacterium]|nr:glycosyltransferase family 2 protein [Candidatus Edwardsbacteria bacterium]